MTKFRKYFIIFLQILTVFIILDILGVDKYIWKYVTETSLLPKNFNIKDFKPTKLWKNNDYEITELKFSQKTIKSNSNNLKQKSADKDTTNLELQEEVDYDEEITTPVIDEYDHLDDIVDDPKDYPIEEYLDEQFSDSENDQISDQMNNQVNNPTDDQMNGRIFNPVDDHTIHRMNSKHTFQKENIQQKPDLVNPKKSAENEYDIQCDLELVETIPLSLKQGGFAKKMDVEHKSILQAWLEMIDKTKKDFVMISQWGIGKSGRGVWFFDHLKHAVSTKNITLGIIHTDKMYRRNKHQPKDLKDIAKNRVEIRAPDVSGKTCPPWKYGIIHSKLIVSDREHFYLGSANVGTRGVTYTKELGVVVRNCPVLAQDARKILDLYWSIDGLRTLPRFYPKSLKTNINVYKPLKVLNNFDNVIYEVFIGSSPPSLRAHGRTDDLIAILSVINNANQYIYIAINEYIPMDLWKRKKSWTVIDDKLRQAITKRKVSVKFLVNSRASHKYLMIRHLKKLIEVDPALVQVKIYSGNIRGFHGTHTKMMVTENSGFIGTSNWTEDYFTTTAGVTIVFTPIESKKKPTSQDLRQQMKQIFLRDFTSALAKTL